MDQKCVIVKRSFLRQFSTKFNKISCCVLWIGDPQKQPPEMFYKIRCSLKFRKIQKKYLRQILFCNKVAVPRPATLLKKKISKNTFSTDHLRTTASENFSLDVLIKTIIWTWNYTYGCSFKYYRLLFSLKTKKKSSSRKCKSAKK